MTAVILEASGSILKYDRDLVVQRALKDDEEKKNQLVKLFRNAAQNREDKKMHSHELDVLLNDRENLALLKSIGLGLSDTKNLFSLLDKDHDGTIEIDEFVKGLMNNRGIITVIDRVNFLAQQVGLLIRHSGADKEQVDEYTADLPGKTQ